MNNLFSYCGLVDARISASEKDLPVQVQQRLIGTFKLTDRGSEILSLQFSCTELVIQ